MNTLTPNLTYRQLSRETVELNDRAAEAKYLADRAWGAANTAEFCPVHSVVLSDASAAATLTFLVQMVALESAIAVHNEHAELLTVSLDWDKYSEEWRLM
jgi:hypothetical protein